MTPALEAASANNTHGVLYTHESLIKVPVNEKYMQIFM